MWLCKNLVHFQQNINVILLKLFVNLDILKNLVEQWTNSEDGIMGFDEFTRKNIVPACILAPTKESFDWRDAQTVLVCPHMYNNITAA